jgi:hypothetical protein
LLNPYSQVFQLRKPEYWGFDRAGQSAVSGGKRLIRAVHRGVIPFATAPRASSRVAVRDRYAKLRQHVALDFEGRGHRSDLDAPKPRAKHCKKLTKR